MLPNNYPVFLSESSDHGSLRTYACKRKRDNFRRTTLSYHRLRTNQSKLLKLHLVVRSNRTRIMFYRHESWSKIMVKCEEKKRSICIGKVYTAHNRLVSLTWTDLFILLYLFKCIPRMCLICRMFNKNIAYSFCSKTTDIRV